ncbi:phenylacetate--CoA ligase family protein [Nonomuraea ferruginea]
MLSHMPAIQRDDLTADETSRENARVNLGLALEAYPLWVERLTCRDLKRAFLAECSAAVPHYRNLFQGAVRDLDRFPVIDRADHDDRRLDFISTDFEDPRGEFLRISTNGTFGRTLRVAWDLPSFFDLNHASYLRFSTVLPAFFSSLVPGEPSVFVISDSPRDLRTSVVMPALDGAILRRLILGRDEMTDVALVEHLRRARIALLHAKPSVLLDLIELDGAHDGGGRIAPAYVVCSGENLYPDDRARIEAGLGCSVLDAYAASEAGLIAYECRHRTGMHVVTDHLTVEVEAGDGSLGPTGTGQLLITNALNWRHAFIRYRIGDRATVTSGECGCGHDGQTIVAMPGRERAAYGDGTGSITAEEIGAAVAAADPPVKQFQVAPGEDHRIVISWVGRPGGDTALAAVLRGRFPGARFELVNVPAINLPGGKLRRFL